VRKRLLLLLKLICLCWIVVICAEGHALLTRKGPLADLGADADADAAPESGKPAVAGSKEAGPATVPLPEKYKPIDSSGIFGLAPQKKESPPVLLGIAGDCALIAAPDGARGIVREGGELHGVKILRLDINRALIEYKGKVEELTMFSGLGSTSILPPEKAAERKEPKP
jgi:hypothetical protein